MPRWMSRAASYPVEVLVPAEIIAVSTFACAVRLLDRREHTSDHADFIGPRDGNSIDSDGEGHPHALAEGCFQICELLTGEREDDDLIGVGFVERLAEFTDGEQRGWSFIERDKRVFQHQMCRSRVVSSPSAA